MNVLKEMNEVHTHRSLTVQKEKYRDTRRRNKLNKKIHIFILL